MKKGFYIVALLFAGVIGIVLSAAVVRNPQLADEPTAVVVLLGLLSFGAFAMAAQLWSGQPGVFWRETPQKGERSEADSGKAQTEKMPSPRFVAISMTLAGGLVIYAGWSGDYNETSRLKLVFFGVFCLLAGICSAFMPHTGGKPPDGR